ncbi:hypothetical protein QCA50_009223 [Cerrena zonata]|uniref:Translocon Sec61/SecY plug domain-containing protein n=1 Tax=Cerrena zonata TaxID=2478898 RepID=A0AAW0G1Z4_9APHY
MAGFRLLEVIHFFLPILPEIETPTDKLSLDEKIIFTIGSGLIFLISQLPLFGLVSDAQLKINDPFIPIRSIFALEKGTLLELGLLPVITSAFIWQIAAGSRYLKVNLSYRIDRELYQTGQKLTAFILAIVFGTGLILSGYYDDVIHGYNPLDSSSAKPIWTYALIFGQIVGWNWLVTLLVEIFDKGYGFGIQAALSPIRVVTYSATIILLSCWFAQFWSKISGSAPKDIAKQFKDQGISIAGKRDVSVAKELSRVIPVASVSGAFVLAALAIVSEIFGGFGKGVGAIVGVSSAFGVLEEFMLEWQQSGGASQFQNAFGVGNKSDLVDLESEEIKSSLNDVELFGNDLDIKTFITSAKSAELIQ